VPVATSLNGKDLIPGVHPLSVGVVGTYSRESANRAVAAADLVCFVGTEAGGMTTHHWQVPRPGVRAVQIDVRPEVLGRHYPLAAAVLGDATSVLEAMLARCNPAQRPAWVAQCREFVREWYGKYSHLLESDAAPVRPERICAELTRLTPPDAVVVVDTGHGGMWMGGMFDVRSSGQSYIRSAGHLGWAFPAGIGAKAAAPDRPVVVFTGDAGFWYHIGELETAVRWGLASVTIVNNNSSGNQSMRGFDRAYGGKQTDKARELWTFRPTDFALVARAMGGIGIRVQHPREFADAYRQALKAAETERKPVVLDVVTDIEAVAPVAVTG
jgi:acetolactate synthase-1/2/3 large subunit